MWPFNRDKHKHTWEAVSTSSYMSLFGVRTIISYKCTSCYQLTSSNVEGLYKLEHLRK
jgi:hypothetical protein